MEKTYNTFIFDLDGTLLDTVPDLTLLTNRILRDVGAPEHTQAEILSYVGAGVRRLIYLALPSDTPKETQDRAMHLWSEHFHEYYEHTEPFDGITDMLTDLLKDNCKLAVVSNKLQEGVDLIMKKKLPGYIDIMIGEREGIPRKPDPTGIKTAMGQLGSIPKETIYIGDSPGDIKAGKNAGCATAAVLWGYHKKQDFFDEDAVPDYFVNSPKDLLKLAN